MNKIYVYENFKEEPKKMGILYIDYIRGNEICSFEYDLDWLNNNNGIMLDPELPSLPGRFYSQKNMFGIFEDCSPNRWGRTLMNRKEIINANKEKRQIKKLNSSDYLIGV